MAALLARHSGASRPGGTMPRPCEPDDIILALDSLYRRKRIDLAHARVLRAWGERGFAPDARVVSGTHRCPALDRGAGATGLAVARAGDRGGGGCRKLYLDRPTTPR
jgi:hypothetical protein